MLYTKSSRCYPANTRPVYRAADINRTVGAEDCKDINGNQFYCDPGTFTPCPLKTDFCNKILDRLYCCNWEEL